MAKIAWLVAELIEGSGGHRTIFQNVKALVDAGHECDVYIQKWPQVESASGAKELADEWYGNCGATFHLGFELTAPCDLLFSTLWITAQYARKADCPLKGYFIQDYEPLFHPMGDQYLAAEQTYNYGFGAFTIGNWLAGKMVNEYGANGAAHFDFCADLNTYRPLDKDTAPNKEDAICYVYQPQKPRRCAHIGLTALEIVKKIRPETTIYLYGSNEVHHEFPFECNPLGLLPLEMCNELYNKCKAGLCISASNPSRVPFEMMAAGLPVVDVHRDNNLYDIPDEAVQLAEPNPESVAQCLIEILDSPQKQQEMSNAGISFMKERPLELGFRQFVSAVENYIETGNMPKYKTKKLYLSEPTKAQAGIPILDRFLSF